MDSTARAATPTPTFSQVVFTGVPQSYSPATNITCCYTLSPALKPNPRDWVGIFKVGWSSTKDYHTFVWVELCLDEDEQRPGVRQILFKDYYLPKDEIEFYQFCYVDSTSQVRGASTPFCFRSTAGQSMECSVGEDLLVVTTQDQVEESAREKAELQEKLDQIMEEREGLKRALEEEQRESASRKLQNDEREKENRQLVDELDQMKEQNEDLKRGAEEQEEETQRLKETVTRMTNQMEAHERNAAQQSAVSQSLDGASKQNETHLKEKYERAVMKINQQKEEIQELRKKLDAGAEEISTLNSKIREDDRELSKMKDGIQLLQVDLASSEKEKDRLSDELRRLQSIVGSVDDLKREKQELCRKLLLQETLQNSPGDDLKAQCQTLDRQLQDAQTKLAAVREELKGSQKRAVHLEGDLAQIKKDMEDLKGSHEHLLRTNSKQELQIRQAHEVIADRDTLVAEKEHLIRLRSREKEALSKEKEELSASVEELRRLHADLQAAQPAESAYEQPDDAETHQPETHDLYEYIAEPSAPEETLQCRHCQEKFPFITQDELELHEQSHRVCPFCTLVCDSMEQTVFEDHVYGHEL